ncbi:tetratricopeptide repeat protein [Persephonella sp.]
MKFVKSKTTGILVGLLFASLLIFAGIHMIEEKEVYELAKEMEKEGEFYYQRKEYKKAKLFFDRALKRYNDLIVLKIIKSDEIKQLENRIKTDPILQKVAKGYIYYNGKWVNEKELEALMKEKRRLKQKIDIYLKTAKFFNSIEDIENNIRVYQKALQEIENSPFANDKEIKKLKSKLISELLFMAEEAARKYEELDKPEKTAHYYRLILSYRDDITIKEKLFKTYMQLFNHMVENGRYTEALAVLLEAKKLGIKDDSLTGKIEQVVHQIDPEKIEKLNIKDSDVYYILAKQAFEQLDIEEAREYAKKALQLNPENTQAKLLLAKIMFKTGNLEKAQALVKEVLEKEPENVEAVVLAGDIYLKSGKPEEAVKYYEKAVGKTEIQDRLFRAYRQTGFKYFKEGEFSKAEDFLKKAVSIKDDPQIYKALGDIYYSSKKYKLAEKNYLNAVKIDPKLKKEIKNSLGNIYKTFGDELYNQKKYRQAISYYRKALSYLGEKPEIIQKLAESYEKTGNVKTALNYYQRLKTSISREKKAQLYLSLGEKEYQKGNYFSALKHFQKALSTDSSLENKLKSRITQLYIEIADRYFEQGNYSRAVEYYTKAVNYDKSVENSIKDRLFKAYLNLGKKAFKAGRYKTAFSYLRKAESLNSSHKEVVYYLGEIYLKEGNLKKALQYFEKYLSFDSSNPEVLYKLAFIQAKLGALNKAKNYAEKLLQLGKHTGFANFIIGAYYYYYENSPDKALRYFLKAENSGYKNGDLHYYLGKLYYDKGNYLRAVAYLTEAINKGYKKENVYYLRALAYFKLNDYRKAINDLSMVVKYNPDNAKAYYLRGKLYYEHGDYVKGEYKKAIEDLEKAAAMGVKEAEKLLQQARKKRN